jgi:DNA replication protein DnaC
LGRGRPTGVAAATVPTVLGAKDLCRNQFHARQHHRVALRRGDHCLEALRWLDADESVILYGRGVGKTHVAQALRHHVACRGGHVRFVKCARMLADLAGGHADRTIGQRMREYTRPLVLIIDDFAMREHTTTQSDDLYDLVSDRAIAGKPLILTSNRAPKDWYPLFPNPVVAESLLDRLINTSHQVLTNGTQTVLSRH